MQEEGRELPRIVRAREYRLYDERGRRYIDFYQNGGRALLGHRPAGAARAVKASFERGLVAEYPTPWSGRLEKLLRKRFPGLSGLRSYRSPEEACRVAGGEAVDISFREGRARCAGGEGIPLWRPGGLDTEAERELRAGRWGSCFLPLLPFPGGFAPGLLCLLRGGDELPPSETISPLLEALLVRAAAGMQKWEENADTEAWARFDFPGVERSGPYLRFSLEEGDYRALRARLLQRGVLLPPTVETPAVVPGEFTEGEVKPLLEELEGLYGDG
jgi:hypothetical protein